MAGVEGKGMVFEGGVETMTESESSFFPLDGFGLGSLLEERVGKEERGVGEGNLENIGFEGVSREAETLESFKVLTFDSVDGFSSLL